MVMTCCNNTYVKYQHAEHDFDMNRISEVFGDGEVTTEHDSESDWSKTIFSITGTFPRNSFILMSGKREKLCSCDCHTIGINVMH